MLIASSVLKDQKGNQLSHTLNRLQHQNTHQHNTAAPAAHQLMSVVFVQSAVEKSLLEEIAQEGKHKWIQLAFHPEFIVHCSWGQEFFFNFFLRNTQEEKESCLFPSYTPSLQTTNPFKDFSESWPECTLSQSKGTQCKHIKVEPEERASFFTCFNGWQHFHFHLTTWYSAQLLSWKHLEKLKGKNNILSWESEDRGLQSCTDSSEVAFECGCAQQDVAIKQHLQSTSFSSPHQHQGGQQLPHRPCSRPPVVQAKLNFAAHGSSLGCSSWWETREESDLLFLLPGMG